MAGLFTLALVLTTTTGAQATGKVHFTAIHYDPGTSVMTNANLNKEYVTIRNGTTHKRYLHGWRLVDERMATNGGNQAYRFPTFTLRPGAIVRVHTGKGARTRTDLYWGLSHWVWGNSHDTAYLRNSAGTLVDSCHYDATTDPSPATC